MMVQDAELRKRKRAAAIVAAAVTATAANINNNNNNNSSNSSGSDRSAQSSSSSSSNSNSSPPRRPVAQQQPSSHVTRTSSPLLQPLVAALASCILTIGVLYLSGQLGRGSRSFPSYSTFQSTGDLDRACAGPPLSALDPVPWQRARDTVGANPLVAACVPAVSLPGTVPVAQYRGPAHRGLISTADSDRMPLLSALSPLWVVDGVNVGIHTASKSSPVVWRCPATGQATLFVGADSGRLYALDGDTGALRWVYHVRPSHNGIHGTPAVDADGERVYIGNYGGWMSALNASTGALVWETQVGQSIGASPVLVGERVCSGIEMNKPRANGYVACLSKRTGHVLFYSDDFGDHTHGTPTVVWRTGPGSEGWSAEMPAAAAAAATASGRSQCNWNAQCRAALSSGDFAGAFTPAVLDSFEAAACAPRSPFATESKAAAASVASPSKTLSPSDPAGLLLIGANTGVLYAIDSSSGKEVWRFETRGARGRPVLLALQRDRRAQHKRRTERRERRRARLEHNRSERLRAARAAFEAEALAQAQAQAHSESDPDPDSDSDSDLEWSEEVEADFLADDDAHEHDEDALRDDEEPLAEEEQAETEDEEEEGEVEVEVDLDEARDPADNSLWVEEDTAEFCRRAPELCARPQTSPWLWLLNHPTNGNQGQIKGTLATLGGIAVFTSWDSFVYGVDVSSGRLRWSFQTRSLGMSSAAILPAKEWASSASAAAAGPASSPASESESSLGGTAFVGTHDGVLYALDVSTGRLEWRHSAGGKAMSSGVLTRRDGGAGAETVRQQCGGRNPFVLVWGTFDGVVHELCAANGRLLGQKQLRGGAITNEIAVKDNTMYISTNGGKVVALRADD